MKKAISVLLVLAVCLMSGAWYTPDAYQVYKDINDTTNQAKSFEMDIRGSVDVEVSGESMSILLGGTAKAVTISDTEAEMEMLLDMYLPGMDAITLKTYFKDGVMYQDVLGTRSAVAMDLEEAMEAMGVSGTDFDRDVIENIQIKEVAKGKEVTVVLDTALMNTAVNNLLDTMGETGGAMTMDSITYVMVAGDDNMMDSYSMEMVMSMGAFTKMIYKLDCQIVSVDAFDSINFPADLDSYGTVVNALSNTTAEASNQGSAPAAAVSEPEPAATEDPELALAVEDDEDSVVATTATTTAAASATTGERSYSVLGKWSVAKLEAFGLTVEMDEFASYLDDEIDVTFDFKFDGSVQGVVIDGDNTVAADGTYTLSGNKVIITFDGDSEIFELIDGELVWEFDGMIVTFRQ